jgi:ACS family D-galactonate transporter-like MFS transporter
MARTKIRFLILGLISVGTVINYLDRAVLGIAAPLLSKDLNLDAAVMGVVFSAFSWTYTAGQIPAGILLDRLGTRIVYFFSVGLWSLFTLLQGLVGGLPALLACRFGLGAAEAPCFPANSRVLGTWFPQGERARANGVFSLGQYFGLAFLSPVLFWIASGWGWRVLFILAGLIGLVFAALWLGLYVEPRESKRVNQAEIDHIVAGGGLRNPGISPPPTWRSIKSIIRTRQFAGSAFGQFASNSTLVFFLTWFPTYLASERHIQLQTVGFFAVLPYVSASAGVLFGGWMSDWLIAKTGSATLGRKLPVVAGLLMATTIAAASFVHNDAAVVGVMSFVFFGQGMCNLGWTLITDVAPRQFMGLTAGLFNLCANVAGIATPMVVGFIVGGTGSFSFALAYISALALLGVFSYVFLLGPVKRIEIPDSFAVALAPTVHEEQ